MAPTRPACDPASECISTEGSSSSATTPTASTSADTHKVVSALTSVSSMSSSSSATLSTTSTTSSSTLSSNASQSSGTAVTVTADGYTSISWGPAITASPYPATTPYPTTVTPDPTGHHTSIAHIRHQNEKSFTAGQKQVTIATVVVGGVFIIALLYTLYRRRNGATVSEIVHFRKHCPSTIVLSEGSPNGGLTALPIYREERFSMHSSKHASLMSWPKPKTRKGPCPPEVVQRYHALNPYVKNQWKTEYPPSVPTTPSREGHSFLIDASPTQPSPLQQEIYQPKEPEKVRIATRRMSDRQSRMTQQSSADTTKSGLAISVLPSIPSESDPKSPPIASPSSQQHLQSDRWSWTNSQAPTTPRMYAPNHRTSSVSTGSRFRSIKSWVRGQNERIEEEQRPDTSSNPNKPVLKNQASMPVLAPPVPTKPSKKGMRNAQRSSISSLFRAHPGTKALTPLSPKLEGQPIEMRERSDGTATRSYAEFQKHGR